MIDVDLSSRTFLLLGTDDPPIDSEDAQRTIAAALTGRLERAGAVPSGTKTPDLLLLTSPLRPDEGFRAALLLDRLEQLMPTLPSGGRLVLLLSAATLVPLSGFPRYSAEMASLGSALRSAAMRLAPQVTVNGIAAGRIADLAGTEAMLGHAVLTGPGSLEALADTVLFLCDPMNSYCTGQLLAVDGGWSTGYARNF